MDNNCIKWMSNKRLASYTNYAPYEPSNIDERCIHLLGTEARSSAFQWNDSYCTEELYFICEQNQKCDNNNNFNVETRNESDPDIDVRFNEIKPTNKIPDLRRGLVLN